MSQSASGPDDVDDLTRLLSAARNGDAEAREKVVSVVQSRLRRMAGHYFAGERNSHTLQPTALVNEVYIRMFGQATVSVGWQDREHFFILAGRAMRQILVDHARARNADKRGSGDTPLAIEDMKGREPGDTPAFVTVMDLDDALNELAALDARVASVVDLKFFGGLKDQQVADALDVSFDTVRRDWAFAKGWLATRLRGYGSTKE